MMRFGRLIVLALVAQSLLLAASAGPVLAEVDCGTYIFDVGYAYTNSMGVENGRGTVRMTAKFCANGQQSWANPLSNNPTNALLSGSTGVVKPKVISSGNRTVLTTSTLFYTNWRVTWVCQFPPFQTINLEFYPRLTINRDGGASVTYLTAGSQACEGIRAWKVQVTRIA